MPRSVMKFARLMATATMVKDQEFEELKARKYAIRIIDLLLEFDKEEECL